MIIGDDHHIRSSLLMIIYDDHIWWSCMVVMSAHHIWLSCTAIKSDNHVWCRYIGWEFIIYDDHIWSPYVIIINGHHIWWSHAVIMYDQHMRSSYGIIIYNHHMWSPYMIILCHDPEHVSVLRSCLCSDVGCGRAHVPVRLNKCCVQMPVWAECLFVFGNSVCCPGIYHLRQFHSSAGLHSCTCFLG